MRYLVIFYRSSCSLLTFGTILKWFFFFFSVLGSGWGSMIRCVSQVAVLSLMKSQESSNSVWNYSTAWYFYMYEYLSDKTNTITSTSPRTGGILLRTYTLFQKIQKSKRCVILEVPRCLSSTYTSMCMPRVRLLLGLKRGQIFFRLLIEKWIWNVNVK